MNNLIIPKNISFLKVKNIRRLKNSQTRKYQTSCEAQLQNLITCWRHSQINSLECQDHVRLLEQCIKENEQKKQTTTSTINYILSKEFKNLGLK